MWYHGPLRSIPLHKATQKGDTVEVAALLAQGADVTAKDAEGRTALHHAVMRSHLTVVDMLIDKGGPGLLLSKDILGCTPVHLAAVQNQVTLIRKLVTALLKDEGGTTPLHEVARRQCMQDFMGFLHLGWEIAAREDVFRPDLSEYGPAWAELSKQVDLTRPGMPAVVRTMGWQPLHLAAMEGKVDLVKQLVQQHGCHMLERSANSWTPMHYAAAHNQIAVLDVLAQLGCDPSVKDSVMSTPMHVAAGEGHTEAITKLVALGADPGAKDRDGCTPLYCAAAWNRPAAVCQLNELGCASWLRSEEGRTPVHVAAEQGWVQLIDLLVRKLKNKVDSRDVYQFTPLHSAANGGHVGTIQKLIAFSHDVDVRDYLGRTPLHYAALHGRAAAVEELIKQGAAHNACDHRGGFTPLHLAADAGQCEVISRLFELGADLEALSSKGWTPLALANMKGPASVDAIGLLVELGASLWRVMKDTDVETPLHMASRSGRLDIVQKLLRCGADHRKRTKDGSSPLHYAAAFGQTHILETLIKAGIAVDSRDDACNTPLHLAAGCGFLDTATQLVKLGADVNARDLTQCTPLQNAAHGTYSALATMPLNGTQNAVTGGAHANSRALSGTSNALQQQHLTPAQQAAQAAITAPATQRDGKVPVRTGLAWAALAGHAQATAASIHPDFQTDGVPTEYCNLGLLQLLKKASRHRGLAALSPSNPPTQQPLSHALPGQDLHSLGRAQSALQYYAGSKADIDASKELGYEALLKHTEALQLNSMEQDRARLIPVAERLVKLGADVAAHDLEGRTALHLAAGCGDKTMVVRLVALGVDVNCKDSVGGTPMHHAAMANKKEMMFTLARLGCDWRARAEGIDGATAAFVLCGQHTRTTRQQLVEAKLKRAYQEGQAARAAGQDPLAAELAASAHRLRMQAATLIPTAPLLVQDLQLDKDAIAAELADQMNRDLLSGRAAEDHPNVTKQQQGMSAAQADANMAALLREEAGKLAESGKKKAKRKKKSCRSSETGSAAVATSMPDDTDTEQPATPQSGLDSDSTDAWTDPQPPHARASAARTGAQDSNPAAALNPLNSSAHHSRSSSATAESDLEPNPTGIHPNELNSVRARLEAAVTQANAAIEIGVAAGDDVLQQVLSDLDVAISAASENDISVKYGRKVRSRLQLLLHEAVTLALSNGDSAAVAAHTSTPSTASYEWQTAGSRPTRGLPPNKGASPPPTPGASRDNIAMLQQTQQQQQQQQQSQHHQHQQRPQHQHQQHQYQQQHAHQSVGSATCSTPQPPPRHPPHTYIQGPAGVARLQHTAGTGMSEGAASPQLGTVASPGQAPAATPKGTSGNAWGVQARLHSPAQAAMLPKCSPASPASNGLRHGATTITDPVQMMWQQQQIQPPSPPPLPPTSTAPAPRPTVHMWPPLDQATATSRTVGGPQRQQSQQQSPHPQQQQQQQQPSGVQSSGFQPFAHGLPQLRTSTMQSSSLMCPPSPSLSMLSPHASLHPPGPPSSPSVRSPHANIAPLGSAASMGSAGGSPYHAQLSELANFGNSSHQNGQHAAGTLPPPLPANAVTGNRDTPHSASLQSHAGPGQASQEGQLLQATVNGDVTDSTFHLPSGLAEQLSDCHQTPQHSNKVLQQQGLQQNSSRPAADLPSAAHQVMHQQPAQQQRAGPSIRKAKLRSPPGFSKPLDGAAKPFVPSNVTWSRPGSNPGLPITPAAANGKVRSNNTQSQVFAPPGFSHDSRGQQPANLATGQWAMTNGTSIYQGTAHVGSPFDQSSRHRTASDAGSTDSWQVPIMQSQLSQKNSDDTPAAPCFLDSEHDKTSGLAPHMVLEFLGIGHSDERTSNA